MGRFWSGLRRNLGGWLYTIGISLMDERGDMMKGLLERAEETRGLDDEDIHLIMELKGDGCLVVHSYIGDREQASKFIKSLEGNFVFAKSFAELRGLIIEEAAFPSYEVPEKARWVH